MRRSLRAVHHKKLRERITERSGQFKDSAFEMSIWQRFVFIKKRHDKDGNNSHHEDRKAKHKDPDIDVKMITANLRKATTETLSDLCHQSPPPEAQQPTLMICKSNAKKGTPMTNVSIKDLILSEKNNPRVCLLKPCFLSIWKVEYNSKGSDVMVPMIVDNNRNIKEILISFSVSVQPKNLPPKSTDSPQIKGRKPRMRRTHS